MLIDLGTCLAKSLLAKYNVLCIEKFISWNRIMKIKIILRKVGRVAVDFSTTRDALFVF